MTRALADYVGLTKPRVTALVVATAAAGMGLAPAPLSVARAAVTLAGVALMVGAANTLNCWYERDSDRHMTRTHDRALPAGRLSARAALRFGVALALASLAVLASATSLTATLLTVLALVTYVGVYTPLKRRSPVALFVGALPGALPPLIGASAASGRPSASGLALFALLFVWQIPHFLAIAVRRREEYARAGLRVLPVVRGERSARRSAAVWALVLLPVSLLPLLLAGAATSYLVAATVPGVWFALLALSGLRAQVGARWAGRLFAASLVHLTLLSVVLFLEAR